MDVTDCTLIDLATREATDRFEDGIWGEPEEVEVAGLPLNVSARDQRGAAGEREPVWLGEAGDDLGDLLQRAEPLRWAAVFLDPRCPRLSDRAERRVRPRARAGSRHRHRSARPGEYGYASRS